VQQIGRHYIRTQEGKTNNDRFYLAKGYKDRTFYFDISDA
jgi:hypothetical protein